MVKRAAIIPKSIHDLSRSELILLKSICFYVTSRKKIIPINDSHIPKNWDRIKFKKFVIPSSSTTVFDNFKNKLTKYNVNYDGTLSRLPSDSLGYDAALAVFCISAEFHDNRSISEHLVKYIKSLEGSKFELRAILALKKPEEVIKKILQADKKQIFFDEIDTTIDSLVQSNTKWHKLFNHIFKKWKTGSIIFGVALLVILVVGFVLIFSQSHEIQSTGESNSIVILNTDATVEANSIQLTEIQKTLNSIVIKGIPRKAIINQLTKLGAIPDISEADIPDFLNRFAVTYLERLENDEQFIGDSEIQLARKITLQEIDNGDIDAARRSNDAIIKSIQERRKKDATLEAGLYEDSASINKIDLNYLAASKDYKKASEIIIDDDKKIFKYLALSAQALALDGHLFGDQNSLRDAINIFRNLIQNYELKVDEIRLAKARYIMTEAMLVLGERSGDDALIEDATNTFKLVTGICDENNKFDDCLDFYIHLGKILLERGNRPTNTVSGAKEHQKRLLEAINTFQKALAIQTVKASDKYQLRTYIGTTQINLGRFTNDALIYETGLVELRKIVDELSMTTDMIENKLLEKIQFFLTILSIDSNTATEKELMNALVWLERNEKSLRKNAPVSWTENKKLISGVLEVIWKINGDVKYLKQSVHEFRQVFLVLTPEISADGWAGSMIDFGVVVYKLGKEIGDKQLIKEAAEIYQASADKFLELSQFPDRALALSNLNKTLKYIIMTKNNACLAERIVIIDKELLLIQDFVSLGAEISDSYDNEREFQIWFNTRATYDEKIKDFYADGGAEENISSHLAEVHEGELRIVTDRNDRAKKLADKLDSANIVNKLNAAQNNTTIFRDKCIF